MNEAAQPRTLSTQTNAKADGAPTLSRPEINLPVLDPAENPRSPSKLDQVENLIKQQSQLQGKLSADLSQARTEATAIHPKDIGALVVPVGGVFLALSVSALLVMLCVRWFQHRKMAALEVEGAYSDSSQLASGYGDDVAHIDELVERFSAGRMPPEEDADARAERVALSEVPELAAMPAERPDSLEPSEDIDFYLSVFDQEQNDLPAAAPQASSASGDKVSSEVQKVLKSLAEKRLARKSQQRVLQPQMMMEYGLPRENPALSTPIQTAEPSAAVDFVLDLPVRKDSAPAVTLTLPAEMGKHVVQTPSIESLATEDLLPAIEIKPEDVKWKTLLDLALEFVKLGQYDEAVQMYKEVIEHGPAAFQDQARKRLNAVPAQS